MTHVRTPREVFLALVEGVAGQRWAELPDLYAEDAIVTHPFSSGPSALLVGRDQLRAHFRKAGEAGLAVEVHDVVVHETRDPEVVVGELA